MLKCPLRWAAAATLSLALFNGTASANDYPVRLKTFCGVVLSNDGVFVARTPTQPYRRFSLSRAGATTVNLFSHNAPPGERILTLSGLLQAASTVQLIKGSCHCVEIAIVDGAMVASQVISHPSVNIGPCSQSE
jgi:hypothetical protein